MSRSPRLGPPRRFVIYDPETGAVIKGTEVPAYRLKQQMAAFPGMKVMRVASLARVSGGRVQGGRFIPGPAPNIPDLSRR